MAATPELLQRHPFVAGLAPEHLARLASLGQLVTCPAGHVLFAEGDERHELFLILGGRVALELETHGRVLRVETLEGATTLG